MTHFIGNCRGCGYALLKLPENRCPECGTPFDPADPKSMDFNRPQWARWLQKPNTFATWIPALVSALYLLFFFTFSRFFGNAPVLRLLGVAAIVAILTILTTSYLFSARRRLQRRLQKYSRDRQP